ncbi:hypothetical protein ABK040_006626 [Willaertia magna]
MLTNESCTLPTTPLIDSHEKKNADIVGDITDICSLFGHWEILEKENYKSFLQKQQNLFKEEEQKEEEEELNWLNNIDLKTKMFNLLLNYSDGDLFLHHILPFLTFQDIFHSLYLVNKKIAIIIQHQDLFKIVLPLKISNICLLMKYILNDTCQMPEMLKKDKEILKKETNTTDISGPLLIRYYVEKEDYNCCKTFPSILSLVTGLAIDLNMLYNIENCKDYCDLKDVLTLNDVYNFIIYFYKNLILYKKDSPIILSLKNFESHLILEKTLFTKLQDFFNENKNILLDINISSFDSNYYTLSNVNNICIYGIGNFILNSDFILNNLKVKTCTDYASLIFKSLIENEENLMKQKLENLQNFTFLLKTPHFSEVLYMSKLTNFINFTKDFINENCKVNFTTGNTLNFYHSNFDEEREIDGWNLFIDFMESIKNKQNITFNLQEVIFYGFYLSENYKQISFNTLLQYLTKFNINALDFYNCIFDYKEIENESFNFPILQKLSFINDGDFTFDNRSNNNEENNIFKNPKMLIVYLNKIIAPKLVELRFYNLTLRNIPIDLINNCCNSLQKIELEANLLNDNELKQLLNITKENKNLIINFKENQLQDISLLQYFIKNNIIINTKSNGYNIIGIKDDKNLIIEDKSNLIFTINPFEYKSKQFFQSDNSLELYLLNYTQYMKNLKSSKVIYQSHEIFQNNYHALIDILNLTPTPSLDDSFFNDAFLYLEKKKLKTQKESKHPYEYYINLLYSAPLFIKDTDNTTLFSVEFDYPMGVFQLAIKKGLFGQTDRRKNKEQQQQQLMEEEEQFNANDWLILTLCCNDTIRRKVSNYYVWDSSIITEEKINYIIKNWKKININF